MSIENTNTIDAISINPSGYVVLTISDHLFWDKRNEHLVKLQEKVNAYLDQIESGEIQRIYPLSKGKKFLIEVALKHVPNLDGVKFLEKLKIALEKYEIIFKYFVL